MYRDFQILVAEDNATDAFFLKRALQKEGINAPIEVVETGDLALKYLDGQEQFGDRSRFPMPKLLLLDLNMPGMDGFEVLQWLRNKPDLRRMPALVLSSSSLQQDVDRAHDLGANGYCVKPTAPEDMCDLVRALASFWFGCHQFPTVKAATNARSPS